MLVDLGSPENTRSDRLPSSPTETKFGISFRFIPIIITTNRPSLQPISLLRSLAYSAPSPVSWAGVRQAMLEDCVQVSDAFPSEADSGRWPMAYGCLFSLALSLTLWAGIWFGAARLLALGK